MQAVTVSCAQSTGGGSAVHSHLRALGRKPGAGCTLWVGVGVELPQARGAETARRGGRGGRAHTQNSLTWLSTRQAAHKTVGPAAKAQHGH